MISWRRRRWQGGARAWLLALASGAVLAVASYWVLSVWLNPGQSLEIHALYRYGDPDWFPIIDHLSEFELGDAIVAENLGRGSRAEPLVVCAVHAPLVGFFGTAGYLLADLVVPVLTVIALLLLWRCALLPLPWAGLATFLVLLGAFVNIDWAAPPIRLTSWGLRLPREFTATMWLGLSLAAFYHVCARPPWYKWGPWLLLGGLLGLALQVDFHAAFCLTVAVAGVSLVLASHARPGWQALLRAAGGGVLGGLLTVWPLIVQSLEMNADLAGRMGLITIPRWPPPLFFAGIGPLLMLIVAPTAVLVVLLRRSPPGWRGRRRILLASATVATTAAFGLQISVPIIGRTISPDHFKHAFHFFSALHLVLCASYGLLLAGRGRRRRARRLRHWVLPAVAAILLICAGLRMHLTHMNRPPPRPYGEHPRWGQYRDDFAALTHELDRADYADVRVILSYDRLLQNWWVTFRDGCVFHPVYYDTTLPDAELERRLIIAGKLFELTPEQWATWLNQWPMVVNWLSGAKYHCSPLATWGPEAAYPAEALAWRDQADPYYPFNVLLPPAEWERLVTAYAASTVEPGPLPRLDLLVLAEGTSPPTLPPPRRFHLVYRNRTFRVYRVRQPGPHSSANEPTAR